MMLAVMEIEFVEVLIAVPVMVLAAILSGVVFRVATGDLGGKTSDRNRKQRGRLSGRNRDWKGSKRKQRGRLRRKSRDWKDSKRKWKGKLS